MKYEPGEVKPQLRCGLVFILTIKRRLQVSLLVSCCRLAAKWPFKAGLQAEFSSPNCQQQQLSVLQRNLCCWIFTFKAAKESLIQEIVSYSPNWSSV